MRLHNEWIELPATNYSQDRGTASRLLLEYIKERQLAGNDAIHVALYFISPHARELSQLDLDCLKYLTAMTKVMVVIGRAEQCLLPSELSRLQTKIGNQLQAEGIELFRQQVFTSAPLAKLLFPRLLPELID